MSRFKPTSLLDKIFEGSLLLKGLSAILETIGAALLIFIPSQTAKQFVGAVTQQELFQDPRDFVSQALVNGTNSLWSSSHTFAIVYLIVHAAIKFTIVIGLLKNLRWAYPFSFIALITIILYQCYELIIHFNVGMLLLTIFDLFILWLVWREYQKFTHKNVAGNHQAS
ncbi:DUF2127 domain-containing protein [Candidatus Saccharibacteria bacterium]|nr:DUF2127 domain-containing protein [Candidatus Saccharibacteria bacterium]